MAIGLQSQVGSPRCGLCGGTAMRALSFETVVARLPQPEQIVRCRSCGLMLRSSKTATEAEGVYSEAYFSFHEEQGTIIGGSAELSSRLEHRLDELGRRFGKGRLLDVGCGPGLFVQRAQARGWSAKGIDVSSWVSEQVRQRFGLEVITGDFLSLAAEEPGYDVIHMNHVLEHVSDPLAHVRKAHQLLKPGGHLVIEVPNEFSSWVYRYFRYSTPLLRACCARLLPGRKRWAVFETLYQAPSVHRHFFTPKTLRRLVRCAGLRVVHTSTLAQSFRAWHWAERPILAMLERFGSLCGGGSYVFLIAERDEGRVNTVLAP